MQNRFSKAVLPCSWPYSMECQKLNCSDLQLTYVKCYLAMEYGLLPSGGNDWWLSIRSQRLVAKSWFKTREESMNLAQRRGKGGNCILLHCSYSSPSINLFSLFSL
ncbi:hypothetical protein VNO77_32087 [Canavalia gladiata]|uniref:Uncharacterized protein n=1 Tax=Canavalia gladiata TaxID=3824 RepID=A0AAN9Q4X7_CANGL